MDTSKLKDINDGLASKRTELDRHENVLAATSKVSDTVLFSTISLIKYLEGHVTKTEVTNQLKTIGTPDALKVVSAVNQLHQTLKTHKNTDLTEVTKVMNGILDEAKKLPKDLPKIPETKVVDYSKQFSSLTDAIKAVEKVVKEQKLVAEAPIVNVPETSVNVDAPDLEPLQSSIKDVVKAVNKIVIPEYKTDNKEVEKLLKASNKLLKGILEKPVGGGGGGGGQAWTAVNSTGIPVPLNVDADGNLLTAGTPPVGGATEAKQDAIITELTQKTEPDDIQNVDIMNALRTLLQQVALPSWYDPTTNALRVGTTAVTVSSGTVTTVATVTNLTNFGTNAADVMTRDISINTWANNSRRTIT